MNDNVIIEYIPPTRSMLFQFSKNVCEQMGISDAETIRGLCDFLTITSKITAKKLSSPDFEVDPKP